MLWTGSRTLGIPRGQEAIMRRWAALALVAVVGCTNAPLAGFLDAVHPIHVQPASAPDPLPGPGTAGPPPIPNPPPFNPGASSNFAPQPGSTATPGALSIPGN
jgi:hypothetical protein